MRLTKKQEEALLKRLKQDYEFAKTERDTHLRYWADDRAQYEGEWVELALEEGEDIKQWFYVPKTRTHIHRFECSCQHHFFPGGKARLAKVYSESTNALRPLAAKMLDEVVHAKVDITLKPIRQYLDGFNSTAVEGQGVLQMGWMNGKGQNRPTLEYVPGEHVCWDPYPLTPEKIEFVCREMWLTAEELRRRAVQGTYDRDAVEEIVKLGQSDHVDETWTSNVADPENPQWARYKIVEYWGPQHTIKGEYTTDRRRIKRGLAPNIVATYFDDRVLLRVEQNTYANLLSHAEPLEKLPFVIMTAIPRRGSTYGYSLVRWMRDSQREINLMRNHRRLAVMQELTRKVAVDKDRCGNLDNWRDAKYCGVIPVDGNPNNVVADFAPKTSTQGIVQEEMMLDRELQDLTGITDYHMGSSGPGMQKTATGVSILTEEGNAKQDTMLANMAASGIVPVMRWMAAACIRYVKPKEVQEILGSRTTPPPLRAVLEEDYAIELEAGPSAASKAVRARELEYAAQTYGQIVNAAPEVAIPALMAITQERMRLLGLGHITAMSGAQAPAGQNAGGQPSVAGQMGNAHQMQQPENRGRMPQRAPQTV